MFHVSVASPFLASLFECLTSLRATPFTFEWLAVAELVEVRRFYVSVLFAGGSLVFQHIERMLNH